MKGEAPWVGSSRSERRGGVEASPLAPSEAPRPAPSGAGAIASKAAKAKPVKVASGAPMTDDLTAALAARIAELEEQLARWEFNNNSRALHSRIERLERDVATYREARETAEFTITDLRAALDRSTASTTALKATPAYRLGSLLIGASADWRRIVRLPVALAEWARENRRQRQEAETLLVPTGSATEYTAAAERALEVAEKHGVGAAERWVANQRLRDSVAARALSELASFARKSDLREAVRLAEAALEADPHENRIKRLAFLMAEAGSISEAARLLRAAIGKGARFNVAEEARAQELLALSDLASAGLTLLSKRKTPSPARSAGRRVLVFAAQAFPYHWSSVSIRAHTIASMLTAAGFSVDVVTPPGYSGVGSREKADRPAQVRNVDGVAYHLLPPTEQRPGVTDDYARQASLALISFMGRMSTSVLIAPCELIHGYPAAVASQVSGVSLVLDCWDVIPDEGLCRTERGRIMSRTQSALFHHAHAALARTPAIAARIGQLPGGPRVHLVLDDLPRAAAALPPAQREDGGAFVFGYVGDNSPDVDIESLIELLKILVESGVDARLAIHSIGSRIQVIRDQLDFAGLGKRVTIVSKSPPGRQVALDYRDIDAVVVPFGLMEDAVKSPFQIIAALRQRKCVIALGAKDYADLFGSAVVHADDARGAAEYLAALAADPELRRAREADALSWDRSHPSEEALINAIETLSRRADDH